MFLIYQVINQLNGKRYVGITTQKSLSTRRSSHLCESLKRKSQLHFHRAIRRYGVENFQWSVLEEGTDTKIGRDVREPYWISVLKPEYNMTCGGGGTSGWKPTAEWRRKKSLEQKGIPKTLEHRKKIGQANVGKHLGQIPWNKGKKGLQIAWNKGIPRPKIKCPHCPALVSLGNHVRYHFDNCKKKVAL